MFGTRKYKTYRDAYLSARANVSDKWEHYFAIYDHVFGHRYREDLVYLEIGVQNGGSLETARKLFGAKSKIIGVDLDPACRRLADEGIADAVFIGDQTDDAVIAAIAQDYPALDIVIDDGSHQQRDVILSFIKLFPLLAENGVYLIEDTHSMHGAQYQASFHGIGIYDYFKGLAERLNLHWMDFDAAAARFGQSRETRAPAMIHEPVDRIFSIEFFDSVIAIRKRTRAEPLRMTT